mmetsp:Transcript_12847/g.23908  ORF Transcript_12847/g.23908 Transcript_12847/m.23908 type:complete len:246 (+) Transcript_12847:69-806(+)
MYTVDKIVGKRMFPDGKPRYKVRWKNYPPSDDTWEPLEHLEFVMDEVDKYEKSADLPRKRGRPPKKQRVVEPRPNGIVPKSRLKKMRFSVESQSPSSDLSEEEVYVSKPPAKPPVLAPSASVSTTGSNSLSEVKALNLAKSIEQQSQFKITPTQPSTPIKLPPVQPKLCPQGIFRGLKCVQPNLETAEVASITGCYHSDESLRWIVTFKPKGNEVYLPMDFSSSELKRVFPSHFHKLMFDAICFS